VESGVQLGELQKGFNPRPNIRQLQLFPACVGVCTQINQGAKSSGINRPDACQIQHNCFRSPLFPNGFPQVMVAAGRNSPTAAQDCNVPEVLNLQT
jgi:hypothetical protein